MAVDPKFYRLYIFCGSLFGPNGMTAIRSCAPAAGDTPPAGGSHFTSRRRHSGSRRPARPAAVSQAGTQDPVSIERKPASGWPGVARVVRGQTIALKQRTFVIAATALGAGPGHLLRRQYLPNLASTIIVYSTMTIPSMIGAEAALSFLGVGVPPPTPAWGRTIGDAVAWAQTDLMFLVFPGTALFLVTLAFNLFGDGLRDALDPRSWR
ncbi:MAG TPA: ABC transporter permease [Actinoplanes sp.]|nr:ABC transporter permease [Actinoplanes sp.]